MFLLFKICKVNKIYYIFLVFNLKRISLMWIFIFIFCHINKLNAETSLTTLEDITNNKFDKIQYLKDKIASPDKKLYILGDLRKEIIDYIWLRYRLEINMKPEWKTLSRQEVAQKIVSLKGINYDNIWFWNPENLPDGFVYFYGELRTPRILERSFDELKQKIIYRDKNGARIKKRFVKIGFKLLDHHSKDTIKEMKFDEKTGLPFNMFYEQFLTLSNVNQLEYGENLHVDTLLTIDIKGDLYGVFIDGKLPRSKVSLEHTVDEIEKLKDFDLFELGAIQQNLINLKMIFRFNDLVLDKKINFISLSVDEELSVSPHGWVSKKIAHIHFDSLADIKKYLLKIKDDSLNTINFQKIGYDLEMKKVLKAWEKWKNYEKSLSFRNGSADILNLSQFSKMVQMDTFFDKLKHFIANFPKRKENLQKTR